MLHPISPKVVELKRKLESFMDRHIYPNEELKPPARTEGLSMGIAV